MRVLSTNPKGGPFEYKHSYPILVQYFSHLGLPNSNYLFELCLLLGSLPSPVTGTSGDLYWYLFPATRELISIFVYPNSYCVLKQSIIYTIEYISIHCNCTYRWTEFFISFNYYRISYVRICLTYSKKIYYKVLRPYFWDIGPLRKKPKENWYLLGIKMIIMWARKRGELCGGQAITSKWLDVSLN